MLSPGGVLNEDRHLGVQAVHRLVPVREAIGRIGILDHMPAVDHHPEGSDLGGCIDVLLQQLAARNADAVVGAGHVDHEGGVHHQRQVRLLRGLAQRRCPAGELHHRALPTSWIAQGDLRNLGATHPCPRDGVFLLYVRSDQ